MIKSIDHIVLTTRDADRCVAFYTKVLGMQLETFGNGRLALRFGSQKINLHPPGMKTDAYARHPTPGSLDLCFLADRPLDDVIGRLKERGVSIELAGRVADAGDESVAWLLADVSVTRVDRQIQEVRDIEAALERIADLSYGDCEACGAEIGYERLLALPTARRCVRCQALHEKTYGHEPNPTL